MSVDINTLRDIVQTKAEYADLSLQILQKQQELINVERYMKQMELDNINCKRQIILRLKTALEELTDSMENIDSYEKLILVHDKQNAANAVYQELSSYDERNEFAPNFQTCIRRIRTLEQEIRELLQQSQNLMQQEYSLVDGNLRKG